MEAEIQDDTYDYTHTKHLIEPFQNPLGDEPFFEEMEENYGKLWKFRDAVSHWNFGVNRQKNLVFFRYRPEGTVRFMPWNLNEKVALIEQHQGDYLVIVLREVDGDGHHLPHVHSIMCKIAPGPNQFDMADLLSYLSGSHLDFLADEFESKFWPWNPVSSTVYI